MHDFFVHIRSNLNIYRKSKMSLQIFVVYSLNRNWQEEWINGTPNCESPQQWCVLWQSFPEMFSWWILFLLSKYPAVVGVYLTHIFACWYWAKCEMLLEWPKMLKFPTKIKKIVILREWINTIIWGAFIHMLFVIVLSLWMKLKKGLISNI